MSDEYLIIKIGHQQWIVYSCMLLKSLKKIIDAWSWWISNHEIWTSNDELWRDNRWDELSIMNGE